MYSMVKHMGPTMETAAGTHTTGARLPHEKKARAEEGVGGEECSSLLVPELIRQPV